MAITAAETSLPSTSSLLAAFSMDFNEVLVQVSSMRSGRDVNLQKRHHERLKVTLCNSETAAWPQQESACD